MEAQQKNTGNQQLSSFADVIKGITPVTTSAEPVNHQVVQIDVMPVLENQMELGESSGASIEYANRMKELDISPLRTLVAASEHSESKSPRQGRSMDKRRNKRGNDDDKELPAVKEEIFDLDTFNSLDDSDFSRLNFTTGQRKKIIKIQSELQEKNPYVGIPKEEPHPDEEYLDYEMIDQDEEQCNIISLEKEFDIDLIFKQSPEGQRIMELLKEQNMVDSKLIKAITIVLCEYLVSRFGYHPSAFYKNIIAKSLVRKYSILKSTTAQVEQALWFFPDGRGPGKHCGKLHYHIEYMVKKFKQQIRRSASQNNDENNTNEDPIDDTPDDETNLDEIVNKLKFIVPSEASLDIIKEDWIRTFATRNLIRKMDVLRVTI
ncbi:uncharacterized protein LOC134203011 [Armigeres subalbatus]|uniref:uncharacterized protein LOC134203011 n=1 Tax=Armigeres subalbatus TaxID=124917 RepID=UPI002ED479AB